MISVPFTLPEVYGGFAEGNGVARFDGLDLTLEFEIKDSFFGIMKSNVKQLVIAAEDLAEADIRGNIFGTTVIIRTHRLEEMPGNKDGTIRLKVKRRHRHAAEDLVHELEDAIADVFMNRRKRRLDDPEDDGSIVIRL